MGQGLKSLTRRTDGERRQYGGAVGADHPTEPLAKEAPNARRRGSSFAVSRFAGVAQWKSACLPSRKSRVRPPLPAPVRRARACLALRASAESGQVCMDLDTHVHGRESSKES